MLVTGHRMPLLEVLTGFIEVSTLSVKRTPFVVAHGGKQFHWTPPENSL